ncbi:MAG TPA: protein phosphatase 2C domain-containing protein [Verrucomicrobiae bacterium]|nr:protein phosphatase 2C domain-containing protein [Verrucomicrobiae bacterium]
MLTHSDFEFAAGSVIGREHRDVIKNCQDGFTVVQGDLCTVAIVADGCGSGAHSEVGAQLGVRLLATSICNEVRHRRSYDLNWERIRMDVLSQLSVLTRSMGGDYRETVNSHFLFTVVGALLAYDAAIFFAIGDGVIMVNNELIPGLGPFPGNKPPYLGYGLLPGNVDLAPDDLEFQIVAQCPLDDLESFLIGSDGVLDLRRVSQKCMPGISKQVGGIEQFWTDDRYFDNEELVNRQLKLIGRDWPRRNPQLGLLPDDTALVAGRRHQQPSP